MGSTQAVAEEIVKASEDPVEETSAAFDVVVEEAKEADKSTRIDGSADASANLDDLADDSAALDAPAETFADLKAPTSPAESNLDVDVAEHSQLFVTSGGALDDGEVAEDVALLPKVGVTAVVGETNKDTDELMSDIDESYSMPNEADASYTAATDADASVSQAA